MFQIIQRTKKHTDTNAHTEFHWLIDFHSQRYADRKLKETQE